MLWTMPVTSEHCLAKLPTCDVSCHGRRHAGQPFVRTVTFGGAILLKIVLLVGHVYDLVGHLMPQASGDLVYSTKMADRGPDIGYAMIFPSMTLVKVIAA